MAMKIALIGACGKMGKEFASAVSESNDSEIAFNLDLKENQQLKIYHTINDCQIDVDIIVDFSTSEDRSDFISYSSNHKIPYACFSTNLSQKDKKLFEKLSKKVPILICQNASRGINLIYKFLQLACQSIPQSDVAICEYHHKNKKDSPSGTAVNFEKILTENHMDYQTRCFRIGDEKGFHKISFYLEDEIIEISHQAFSRKIFALGAFQMCKKLLKQKPNIYNGF